MICILLNMGMRYRLLADGSHLLPIDRNLVREGENLNFRICTESFIDFSHVVGLRMYSSCLAIMVAPLDIPFPFVILGPFYYM